ncbi:MAG: ribonuclease HI family protein [Candidatus Pacebacteria bacterium]|nr:ribonuclease HI family protein [Candidatus Paceibacterota bacterium]MDP6659396.1 ribonuclease HI family protein [Candidatus Paceibacterota bacterium]
MKKIIIYTDGGARGNPGPAGAGAIIYDENGKVLKEAHSFLGERTNNWAEYEAVYLGLSEAKKLGLAGSEVEIKLDSELIKEQLSGNYKIKEETLHGQFIKIHNLRVKDFPNVTFTHIPREENSEADRLANEAIDNGS